MELRIGQGFDIHRFAPDRKLFLGGVEIPADLGLLGHSDADVLLHAVADAVLGALALGDIGHWFPDTDNAYRGADSRELLKTILASPDLQGWRLVNLDATILAEKPRIARHVPAIRMSLAGLFQTVPERISVKATTMERIGGIGREEGMAALAVVLLERV